MGRAGSGEEGGRRRRCLVSLLGLAAVLSTAACGAAGGATSELAGFAAGSAAGALTGNPFVAVATGMAVRFGTSEAGAYLERRRQAAIHAAIAEAAGAADEGEIVRWSVETELPPGHAHGQAQTTRSLNGQIPCREVLYNVKGGGDDVAYFVGVICRHHEGEWRWAVSEPTTQHW